MFHFLDTWQVLIGSIIGAASALLVLVIDRKLQRKKERADYILKVDKFLVAALKSATDIKDDLNSFIQDRLAGRMIPLIREDTKRTKISYGKVFFPLLATVELPAEILSNSTGSNYADSRIIDALVLSKEFASSISDAERQFEYTLDSNKEAALQIPIQNRPMISSSFNANFENQIMGYISFLRTEVIERNIPAYIKTLAHARVALREYYSMGPRKWNRKFSRPISEASQAKIEAWLAPKVDEEMGKYS